MTSTHNGASSQLERKSSDAVGGPAVAEDSGLLGTGDARKRVRYDDEQARHMNTRGTTTVVTLRDNGWDTG